MNRFLSVAVACAVMAGAGCTRRTDGALRVDVTTTDNPRFTASCFQVEILKDGELQASTIVPVSSGQHEYQIAVKQDTLPPTVAVRATAFVGDCSSPETRKLASRSETKDETFPASGVTVVTLSLGMPGTDLDFDQDGYVDAAKGGLDCNDRDPNIRPNTTQACGVAVDTNCNGLVGCADPDCAAEALCASPPTRVVLTPPALTTQLGECSSAIALETRDATGQQPVAIPTHVTLSGGAGVSFFSDAACASPITGLDLPAGGANGTFFYQATQVGTSTVVAHADGLTDGTLRATVNPANATNLVFVAGPASVGAGDCSADFTVELRDAQNQATTTAADLMVDLSSDQPTGLAFFGATGCGTPLPSPSTIPIVAGQGRASFRVTGTRVVAMTLTARTTNGLIATRLVNVAPGAPAKVAFTSGDPGVLVNTCSAGPVTLELRDLYDNASPAVGAEVTLTLSATLGGAPASTFHFFGPADTACTTPVTTATIAVGSSTVSVLVSASAAGVYSMRAASRLPDATQQATVASGPPTTIAISPHTPITMTAGLSACSPSAVRVVTLDSSGSRSAVSSALSVAITTTALGTIAFFSDSGCSTSIGTTATIPAGASETSFFFRANRAQASFNLTVSATLTAATTDTVTGYSVLAGPPNRLVWDAPPSQSISAGGCSSPFQLHVEDSAGNLTSYVAQQTVDLASTPAGVSFAPAAGCAGAGTSMSLAAGASSGSFFATSTAPATYSLAATVTATAVSTGTSVVTLIVAPGAATKLVYTARPAATAVAGTCLTATVQLQDAYSNPVAVAAATPVTLSTTAGFDFFAGSSCAAGTATGSVDIPVGASSATYSMRGRLAGVYALTAAQGSFTATPLPSVTITAAATSALRLVGLGTTHRAGECVTNASVQREDAYGNPTSPATALTVALSATGGNVSFSTDPASCVAETPAPNVTIPASASSVAFAFSGTLVTATATVTATAASPALSANGSFAITAGDAARLVLSGGGTTAAAGVCSGLVTVSAEDSWGNAASPATPLTVALTSNSAGGFTFFASASCTAGQELTSVTIPTIATSASFAFRPTRAPESVTVTATSAPLTPATKLWTVSAGPPSKLVWTAPPPSTLSRFTCSGPLTVQVQDSVGNVSPLGASSKPVSAGSSLAAAGAVFFASADCSGAGGGAPSSLLIPAGASEVTFSMMVLGTGSTDIAVSDPAGSAALTPTPAVAVLPTGAQGTLTMTASDLNVEYFGCQPIVLTRNTAGGPWLKGPTTLSVTVADATHLTLHNDVNCTSLTTTSVSPTIADGASTVTVYARGHSGLPSPVVVSAVDPNGGFTAPAPLTFSALPLVRRGLCSIALTTTQPVACTITPAIPANDFSRTFLVFQATADLTGASDSNVACWLTAGSGDVQCRRFGTTGTVTIVWQTASWGRGVASGGVSVQHFEGALTNTSASPTDLPIATVGATGASAFVLFSSASFGASASPPSSTLNDLEDFATARLVPPTTLRLANSLAWPFGAGGAGTEGFHYAAQVVQMGGAAVDRGTASGGTATVSATGLPDKTSTLNRLIHLHTVRNATNNNTNDICKRRYRGRRVTSGTGLTWTRGSGQGGGCTDSNALELAWERIELPAGTTVQSFDLSLATSSLTVTQAIGQVVDDRMLVLFSGQGPGGQASGETSSDNSDDLGLVHALGAASGTSLTITRSAPSGGGRGADFTPFVIQFPP